MEDRVKGATRWCIVQREWPPISLLKSKPKASKEQRVSSETVTCKYTSSRTFFQGDVFIVQSYWLLFLHKTFNVYEDICCISL